ncbi:MAG TPA: bacillithiol system redox-active protein YtxJ [Pyrinomonadaceae bacterium]|jgi:bacillithiol system protein YtxJ
MSEHFTPVSDNNELETLFKLSHERPVVLFKHSLTCPISSAAYQEMSSVETDVSLIIVQRAREVSNEVETLTGIRHESPQAIILRNGRAVWNVSHWNIKRSTVDEALRANA